MYWQILWCPNRLAISTGVYPNLFMGFTIINFKGGRRSKNLGGPPLVDDLYLLLFSFPYLKWPPSFVCLCMDVWTWLLPSISFCIVSMINLHTSIWPCAAAKWSGVFLSLVPGFLFWTFWMIKSQAKTNKLKNELY